MVPCCSMFRERVCVQGCAWRAFILFWALSCSQYTVCMSKYGHKKHPFCRTCEMMWKFHTLHIPRTKDNDLCNRKLIILYLSTDTRFVRHLLQIVLISENQFTAGGGGHSALTIVFQWAIMAGISSRPYWWLNVCWGHTMDSPLHSVGNMPGWGEGISSIKAISLVTGLTPPFCHNIGRISFGKWNIVALMR